MTNIVSIHCTSDYLVKRASRHRRAGRYDEAMALLWKARNQFPQDTDVLMEMADVYEEIGCQEEAVRAYLRLIRLDDKHKSTALFRLALASAQQGDMTRAISYYDHLRQLDDQLEIPSEMIDELGNQLHQETRDAHFLSRKARARSLGIRAANLLQNGKAVAAQRAMAHSLRMHSTARGYAMLACCQLIRSKAEDAVVSAEKAYRMQRGNVQTLCLLADAYMAIGDEKKTKNAIYVAAMRAHQIDDLLSVAVESAKYGEDALTIQIARRILRIAPYHTRAMMICACAYINRKRFISAKRILARLRLLIPENTACESYYRMLCDGREFSERLSLGMDITREEGVNRAAELVSLLYQDPKQIDDDFALCTHVCRMCSWALHSPMAGSSTKTVALILLAALQADQARDMLLDALLDPQLADSIKLHVLQVLTSREGFKPYAVDMEGRLVRLAAGGVSPRPVQTAQANSRIVQRVADVIAPHDSGAAQILLDAYLSYLGEYGQPDARHESACAAALELWYHIFTGQKTDPNELAARYGISVRLLRIYLRRFESCVHSQQSLQQEESK